MRECNSKDAVFYRPVKAEIVRSMARIKKITERTVVILTSLPSFDLALFLVQYVWAPPAISPPRPPDFASCKTTKITIPMLTIEIIIVPIK